MCLWIFTCSITAESLLISNLFQNLNSMSKAQYVTCRMVSFFRDHQKFVGFWNLYSLICSLNIYSYIHSHSFAANSFVVMGGLFSFLHLFLFFFSTCDFCCWTDPACWLSSSHHSHLPPSECIMFSKDKLFISVLNHISSEGLTHWKLHVYHSLKW